MTWLTSLRASLGTLILAYRSQPEKGPTNPAWMASNRNLKFNFQMIVVRFFPDSCQASG